MNQSFHVGCQGWVYTDWTTRAGGETIFYPVGTRENAMLDFYAQAFGSVEVDSTFYALPSVKTIENWMRRTPEGFTFSPKLLQEITHTNMLSGSDARRLLVEYTERIGTLKEKLGVVLIQLPPQFYVTPANRRALHEFLPQLSGDVRWSIEFRSPDWMTEETSDVLREHGIAPTLVEGQWVRREALSQMFAHVGAKFAYIRWMGARDLTRFDVEQRAQDANLNKWARKLKSLRDGGTEVFAYFSNYYEGHAPSSANKLRRMLGETTFDARELETQPSLF